MASQPSPCGTSKPEPGLCDCAFHLALNEFKRNSGLGTEDLQSFQSTRLHELKSAIARIQHEQESKRRLRNMRRLEPFLKTMEQYGKVVEVFVNSSDIVAFIWGPMKFLLVTASSYNEALDSLMDAYQDIWEQLPLLETYQSLIESRPDLKTILVWIYQDVLEFHKEALRYFRSRVWKQLFRAAWRGFGPKIAVIRENMARHKRLLTEGVSAMEVENSRKIRLELREEFERQREIETDRRRDEVLRWLSPFPSREILRQHREARSVSPESGDWLLQSPIFDGWFNPKYCTNPLLWVTGILGAGKSVLASRIIDEAQNLSFRSSDPADSPPSVAYFFLQEEETESNSFLAVARGVLSQLMAQHNDVVTYVYEQRSLSGEIILSSGDLAKSLLKAVLGCCKNTYIVIDGLDSCNRKDRRDIVQAFRAIVESLPTSEMHAIRCVFLSQDDGAARKDLSDIPTIKISPGDSRKDIERYSMAKKKELEGRFGSLDSSAVDLVKVVTAKAQGMFLYAKLVFATLQSCIRKVDLVQELQSIPKGLDETYAKVVQRLARSEETNHSEFIRLLGWLACSKRPIKLFELRAAVSVDLEEQTVHNEDYAPLGARLSDLFGPLVTVRSDQTLNFIHPTAKEYLLKHKIHEMDIHVQLSVLTLGYLSLPGMERGLRPDEVKDFLRTGYYGFFDYSAACWPLHLQNAASKQEDKDATTSLVESVDVFLDAHWTGIKGPSDVNVTQTTLDTLSLFEGQEFCSRLCTTFACAKKQLSIHGQGPSDNEPLDLAEVINSIRQTLEGLSQNPLSKQERQALQAMYGPNLFKCKRPNCVYFHQGFPSAQQRDDHTARHERPYICTEPTCYIATFGCPTKKALQKHLLEEHGIDLVEDAEFPEPPPTTSSTLKGSADFACELCPKRFTRNHNLKIHMRTHQREKPYPCSVCGQRFARTYDRKRHEGLHSGEKKYICSGKLEDGRIWGCGKNFARQDKLTEHYRAKAGRKCLQLLAEEQSRKQAGNGKSPDVAELLGLSFLLDPERFKPFQGVPISSLLPPSLDGTPGLPL